MTTPRDPDPTQLLSLLVREVPEILKHTGVSDPLTLSAVITRQDHSGFKTLSNLREVIDGGLTLNTTDNTWCLYCQDKDVIIEAKPFTGVSTGTVAFHVHYLESEAGRSLCQKLAEQGETDDVKKKISEAAVAAGIDMTKMEFRFE